MKRMMMGLSVLVAAACGGSDSPTEKCDDFISVVCDRAVECVPGAITESQCVQELQAVIPCGRAKSVEPRYDRCMDMMSSLSCGVLFPPDPETGEPALVLPADCNGVILIERQGAGELPASPISSVLAD